nr:MAG TPA: hypothetical protein [Caudoviricetes sp.]
MAEKNSFVVYSQWATIIANLPDEQAAILSKAICCKHLGIEYEITDPTIKAVFISIEQKLDADNENYRKTCEARAKSGRKGGSASAAEKVESAEERDGSNSDEEAINSKQNEAKASKSSFCLANEAKESKSKQNGGDNEYEYEYENENENENENESPTGTKEKSVARDARTPAHETAEEPARSKEPKHKHGEYGHVRLTDAEFVRLKAKHGEAETEAAIRAVDEYVETSGKKPYKNYALALEKWGYRAAREQLQREQADWQSVPTVARSGSTGGRAAPGGFDANDYLLERIANAERSVSNG